MFLKIALALFGFTLYKVVSSYYSLQRNIAIAKESGIPYLVVPFKTFGLVRAHVCTNILYPILKDLPYFRDALWVPFLDLNHSWRFLSRYSDQIGNGDLYMLVSPSNFFFVSSNAEINWQIATRRSDFPKPIKDYIIMNHFGRSLVSSEGADWKRQRKIVAPAFSEKSNAFVWEQSLQQAQSMLKYWSTLEGNNIDELNIGNTQGDIGNLAVHVICGAGFGVPQLWPHEDESILGSRLVPGFNTKKLHGNHKMDFKDSLRKTTGLEIIWLAVLPRWLIRRSPFKVHKVLLAAYEECQQYFAELFEYKRHVKRLKIDESEEGTMDLMGPLVKASENVEKAAYAEQGGTEIPDGVLTSEEILGNAFLFMFAGHDTSSGTLQFALIHLAMHPTIQIHLQSDIDNAVGSRPASDWSYAVDLRNLYNSMVGAVLYETVRITAPSTRSPKINHGGPKKLILNGHTITLPGNDTYIYLDIIGTGYNPRNFPTSPSKITPGKTDIAEFVPERWLTVKAEDYTNGSTTNGAAVNKSNPASEQRPASNTATAQVDGLENASFEAAGSLFRPSKGAFISFAEGARACPGRRFVQVQMSAVLAVIFSQYTVELDVRDLQTPKYLDGITDEKLSCMTDEEKRDVFAAAKERAWGRVRASVPAIGLKLGKEGIGLRFFRRGRGAAGTPDKKGSKAGSEGFFVGLGL